MIARGIARLQGQRGGHSPKLFAEDAATARALLDWPHAAFEVPADLLATWRAMGRRHGAQRAAWQQAVVDLPAAARTEFERTLSGALPAGVQAALDTYKREAPAREPLASGIFISAELNDLLADTLPERMVACADLEAPTSHKRSLAAFTAQDRSGRYLHCGVREHVMGSMANGMAAHGGIVPLTVPDLAFADYERPAMRMAALMHLPVLFVFSHDSIGIGRNEAPR